MHQSKFLKISLDSDVMRRIYIEGGLRAYYVGLGSTLVRGNFLSAYII